MVSDHDLAEGRVYPPLKNILQVSIKMAKQIGGFAYRENMALVYPEPLDKEEHIPIYSVVILLYTVWLYYYIQCGYITIYSVDILLYAVWLYYYIQCGYITIYSMVKH